MAHAHSWQELIKYRIQRVALCPSTASPYTKVKIIECHRHPYKKFIFIHKKIAIVLSSSLAEKIMIACLYAMAKH